MDDALRLLIYFAAALFVVVAMLVISWLLGERHREKATEEPYESGVKPSGSGRTRFSAKFYLVGLLFLIFDLEAVFLFAWAIGFRQSGWAGYIGALVFMIILTAVLVYEWREGALDWFERDRRRIRKKVKRELLAPPEDV